MKIQRPSPTCILAPHTLPGSGTSVAFVAGNHHDEGFGILSCHVLAHRRCVFGISVRFAVRTPTADTAKHMHDRWTSLFVDEDGAPTHWGDIQDGYVRLRDDGSDGWPHALVSPDTFYFFLPMHPSPDRPWEHALVMHIHDSLNAEIPILVHLFASRFRIEFYGLWSGVAVRAIDDHRVLLTLKRNLVQTSPPYITARDAIPLHVRVHEHYLRRNMPLGWVICHEDCNTPTVVQGIRRNPDTPRCHMTLTHGCRRICVISVPSMSHVTPYQISKCTHLRDRFLCRTVLVTGIPPDVTWYDFGDHDTASPIQRCQNLQWLQDIGDEDD